MLPDEHEAYFLFSTVYDRMLRGIVSGAAPSPLAAPSQLHRTGLPAQHGLIALRKFLHQLITRLLPMLAEHLSALGPEGKEEDPGLLTVSALDLLLDQHLTPMVITLFTGVPIETQMRVWDVFFCVGMYTMSVVSGV